VFESIAFVRQPRNSGEIQRCLVMLKMAMSSVSVDAQTRLCGAPSAALRLLMIRVDGRPATPLLRTSR